MRKKMIYAEVTVNEDFEPLIINISQNKGSRVALIANTHRVVVRVADLSGHSKRLTPRIQWQLVQESFPMGPAMNENTHIFDGGVFTNSDNRRCFMMVALPKAIAEPIVELGIEKWGSVHKLERLDTVEHVLFRYYTNAAKKPAGKSSTEIDTDNETPMSQWVVLPQDMGHKVLYMEDGLPHSAHYISSHPELREAELDRVWHAAVPSHVTILARTSDDEATDSDSSWLREFVKGRGVGISNEMFRCLSRFV